MALLIDGYNLLHVTGIFGRGRGPGRFERSRQALVRFLVASIDPAQLRDATIVFDAADAPPGLPSVDEHEGLQIRYAQDYPDADTLLEELINEHNAPRTLTVVSSDHRVQRAARRRKARPIDSEVWYSQLLKTRSATLPPGMPEINRTNAAHDPAEVDYWLAQFADQPTENQSKSDGANPFPPGYGEDLLDDLGA